VLDAQRRASKGDGPGDAAGTGAVHPSRLASLAPQDDGLVARAMTAAPALATEEVPFTADLAAIRALATVLPGALPTALNGIRIAASIRPRKLVIAGGDETPVRMPRTAFQLVYPDATVMIDAGMDRATHESFGADEPYDDAAFATLRRALDAARLIVLTHFHADHVAGVVTAPNFAALAAKTIVSESTLDAMLLTPHRPHLRLTSEMAAHLITLDYPQYYPVAPGVVLVQAPGHSVDHQMVYIRLQSGREILHSVDVAWNMANIHEVRGKAAPWVKEDVPRVMGQLRWLKEVDQTEPNVTLLVTHDDECFESAVKSGTIGASLVI
jgi:glyoxylase-like metal-dependent hydrolase (beta-lactamase superfamily II)